MDELTNRKGIILAGGTGSRLSPITKAISKQLMPVYDKPMIYYPLSTLLIAGIKEILIICTPFYLESYKSLLGDGTQWGININYKCQKYPDGIAQAFVLGEEFLNGCPVCLILGDNLFYGDDLSLKLKEANDDKKNGTLFAYQVNDPYRYGIVQFDSQFNVLNIQEKPSKPLSNYAITGIYFYDNSVVNIAKNLKPSKRGELEITDINNALLARNQLKVKLLKRGMAWLDTGTVDSLHDAGTFIKTIENRQGLKIGCPEEIAFKLKYINEEELKLLSNQYSSSDYGKYLLKLIKNI
ncbi:MAG: glucose-1-phosphate thymidylyltransferase [Rickettsiales bacterium]|nr:glucose-1-phosphate thymidylyltransferase [Rickettsiales bacterium]